MSYEKLSSQGIFLKANYPNTMPLKPYLLPILFSLCWGNTLKAQEFELEKTFKSHKEPLSYVTFREEDNLLISGDESGEIIFWNTQTGKAIHRAKEHKGLVTHIEFSPDAMRMVSASYDGTIKIWSLTSFNVLYTFKNSKAAGFDNYSGAEPCFVLFTPDSKGLIYGGYNLEVLYSNIETGATQTIFSNDFHTINCGQISPDGQELVIAFGSQIRFFDLRNFSERNRIDLPDRFENYICELEFRPQTSILSAWLYDGRLQSWDIKSGRLSQSLKATEQKGTSNIAFSGDGQFIVTGNQGNHTKLWDVEQKKVIQLLKAHKAEVVTFDYSKDGTYIVTGGRDHIIHLWKKNQDKLVRENHVPEKVKDRIVEPQEVIRVRNANVELFFWDNRKIDGDIISVRLNDRWILEKYGLKGKRKKIPIRLSAEKNYLIIHAENEGEIRPNTIALTIKDGDIEKTITLKSSLNTSAALSIFYDP